MEQMKQITQILPREAALKYGISAATDVELLQIMLRTGTAKKSSRQLARQLLTQYENLAFLSLAQVAELTQFSGIGNTKAIELQAAFELGKRALAQRQLRQGVVFSSGMIGFHMQEKLRGCLQEKLIAVYLDTKNQIIQERVIFIGGLNSSVAHPREIFQQAVRLSAARLIIVHNHPSGQMTPSQNDIRFSQRLIECGELMGIDCLDHLIIGAEGYLSLKEEGLI